MYKIVRKHVFNPTETLLEIEAPAVAKKAQPGQFIILRVDEEGERIPLTVGGYDREKGTYVYVDPKDFLYAEFDETGKNTNDCNNKK